MVIKTSSELLMFFCQTFRSFPQKSISKELLQEIENKLCVKSVNKMHTKIENSFSIELKIVKVFI